MQTFDTLFAQKLKELLEKEIKNARDRLENNTYENVGQFKYVMGQLNAYRMTINELIEIAKEQADQSNR